MTEWQPIETAPKDMPIIGGAPFWASGREVCWAKDHWECAFAGTMSVFPTHWTPLPTPPRSTQ